MHDFRSIHTKRNAVPTSVGETAAKQDGGQNRCRQDSLQLLYCIVLLIVARFYHGRGLIKSAVHIIRERNLAKSNFPIKVKLRKI